LDKPLVPGVREMRLLNDAPWVRSLGRLELTLSTEGWTCPAPTVEFGRTTFRATGSPTERDRVMCSTRPDGEPAARPRIRIQPTSDTILFKDRLLCLL